MSNKATLGLGLVVFALASTAEAQAPVWRRVGNAVMDLQLAGLATLELRHPRELWANASVDIASRVAVTGMDRALINQSAKNNFLMMESPTSDFS